MRGVRRTLLVVGALHLGVASVGGVLLVRTLITRTDAQYICRWPYTPISLRKLAALRRLEPGSVSEYRALVDQCQGSVVGDAAERLGAIGEPRVDIGLLERALGRGQRDDVTRQIRAAVEQLRARDARK